MRVGLSLYLLVCSFMRDAASHNAQDFGELWDAQFRCPWSPALGESSVHLSRSNQVEPGVQFTDRKKLRDFYNCTC